MFIVPYCISNTGFYCVFKAMVRDVKATIMMTRKFLSNGIWHGIRLSCPHPKLAFQRNHKGSELSKEFL